MQNVMWFMRNYEGALLLTNCSKFSFVKEVSWAVSYTQIALGINVVGRRRWVFQFMIRCTNENNDFNGGITFFCAANSIWKSQPIVLYNDFFSLEQNGN